MEQILLHLIGDYLTQTDWMANNKTKSWLPATTHALVYSLPFLLVFHPSIPALLVIGITHYLIDRYRLARYVVFAKNWSTNWGLKWKDCDTTGYHKDTPLFIAFWLMIIADNTLHLCINYAALMWL